LAGCSKAPDNGVAGEAASNASTIAFAYQYDLRLPSNLISDVQEAQAQACEHEGVRCRITGMTFRVDEAGAVAASLDVKIAASIARTFGRDAVKRTEASGGALIGAEITGTDTEASLQEARSRSSDANTDEAAIDRQLARPDLTASDRSNLLARKAEAVRQQREGRSAATSVRESVAFTPMHFSYVAGSGVGLQARLMEVAHAAYVSLTWTLTMLLSLLAYAGPPLIVVFLLALAWYHFGRKWWARLFPAE
jgi:hypothetical protein